MMNQALARLGRSFPAMTQREDAVWLGGTLALVAAVLVRALDLRAFDFSVPFSYESDALQYLAVFRTVLTTGWYTETTMLGAPFGMTHHDVPVPDGLFLLMVSLLRPFTRDPAVAFNLFFIGGFFVVPAAFFYAARMLGVPRPFAAVGALAYAFLPFHFLRVTHLFYTLYFFPPLIVACAVKLLEEDPRRWLTWRKALLFAAAGASGVYNAFFFALILAFAGLVGALAMRQRGRLVFGLIGAALVVSSTLANLAPSVIYHARNGANLEVAKRNAGESEIYGLKLTQLLLPHGTHPVPALAAPAQRYGALTFTTENHTAALGIIGSAGFLLSLAWLFFKAAPESDLPGRRIELLSKVNAFLFLFATVGGFGVMFALVVSAQLRAWNRASVVIAAMALLVLLLALTRWSEAGSVESVRRRRRQVATLAMLAIWAMDQAPQRVLQPARDRQEHAADAAFVAKVAALVPAGTMVLQLPHVGYPETPAAFQEGHYGMFRPYVHDTSLRWSYGGVRGRESDLWLRALGARPVPEQLEAAAGIGFGGIYVERRGYADNAVAVERQLAALLGPAVVERADGKTAFYRIAPAAGK